MNSSNQSPQPRQSGDKQPAKRSFGPFLIITTALLLLLVIFGGQGSTKDIPEDEFWYLLYTGGLEKVKLADNQKITGKLRQAAVPGEDGFRTTVASTTEIAERVRAIKAKKLDPETLKLETLQRRVTAEEITLLKGYPIRMRRMAEDGATPKDQQRFFLDYLDVDGLHYAEVYQPDMVALRSLLKEQEAEIESGLVFDLSEGLETEGGYSPLLYFLSSIAPILLLVALFWFLFMRQMRGQGQGLMSFGRSRPLLYNKEKQTNVTFADVAGIDEAKDEVRELIEFLKNPTRFTRLGGRIPRGVLLVGPPGTGKTLLAKAIAGEAEVPFLSISGSDFVEMFVGVGASRVRDLFKQARESAPCIIFLDEIDAVGRKRGSGMGGGHDEREQTLNAILVEMDGFGTDEGIIVVAATNRPDVLDPALLRPGRFDREIMIDLPDVAGREKILAVHSEKVPLADSVRLEDIARGTPGFSGAELASLVNEAAIIAVMRGKDVVGHEDLEEARDKVRYGREKRSRVMDHEDKRITAYHEAGHAVVGEKLEHAQPVHKVTIIPRGMALGATMFLPEKEQLHMSRLKLLDELAVLYGGHVAEDVFCGDITSGASNDIQRATHLVRLMVTEWGMSERLGPINFASRTGSEFLGTEIAVGKDFSEATVREIDEEVTRLLSDAHERARGIVTENREAMERVAQALLMYETIHAEELTRLVGGTSPQDLRPSNPPPTPPPVPKASSETEVQPRPLTEPGGFVPPGKEGLSPA